MLVGTGRFHWVMSNHPTGIAGVLVSLLLILAGQIGLDLDTDTAVVIVGAIVAIVSKFTPRDNSLVVLQLSPEGTISEQGE